MPTNAIDAPLAAALPVQVGPAVTTYPFRENGDLATRVTTRPYKQAAAHFAPALYGTVDPADPSAYLVDESDPAPSLVPSLLRFERTYATIPLAQVIPTTKLFERPVLNAFKSGSSYAVTIDNGLTSHIFNSRQTVTGVGSINATSKVRAFSLAGAHGAAVGDIVILWNGDTLMGYTDVVFVGSATQLSIKAETSPWSEVSLAISHLTLAKDATYHIYNGPIRCSAKRTQNFYLPGVTPGVSQAADIEPPSVVTGQESWLAQVVSYLASPSNATFAVHEVSDLQPWRGTIVMQEVLSLQLADAVRTV